MALLTILVVWFQFGLPTPRVCQGEHPEDLTDLKMRGENMEMCSGAPSLASGVQAVSILHGVLVRTCIRVCCYVSVCEREYVHACYGVCVCTTYCVHVNVCLVGCSEDILYNFPFLECLPRADQRASAVFL